METPYFLWATTSSVCLPHSEEGFSPVEAEFSVFYFLFMLLLALSLGTTEKRLSHSSALLPSGISINGQ